MRVLSTSCSAISRFVRPAATSAAISCSRAVSGPAFLDLGQPGPTAGDVVVFTDGLEFEDGTAAGELSQVCTLTKPGHHPGASGFECVGSIALEDGTITIAGPFSPAAADQAQAVTGGTGAYRAARGDATIRAEEDVILVRLLG